MKKQHLIAVIGLLLIAHNTHAQTNNIRLFDQPNNFRFSDNTNSIGPAVTTIGSSMVGSQLSRMWLFAIAPREAMSPLGMPNMRSASSNITLAGGALAGAFFGDALAKKKDLSPLQGLATSSAMWVGMFVGGNIGAAIGGVPVYYKFTFNDVSSLKSRAPLYYAATLGSIGAVAAGMAVLSMIADDADHVTSTTGKVQFDVNPAGLAQYTLKQPSPNQTKIASLRCSW